jgi:hypothetical protein
VEPIGERAFLENQRIIWKHRGVRKAARLGPIDLQLIKLAVVPQLGLKTNSRTYYEKAIEYFDKAAKKMSSWGSKTPAILGIAAHTAIWVSSYCLVNMNKALQYNPYSPDVYAQLVWFTARRATMKMP